MPKQGQFGRSKRQKVIRNLHQRRPKQANGRQTIDPQVIPDFIVARYALTTARKIKEPARESGQRFLQELVPNLMATHYDVTQSVHETLRTINARVPWQFLMVLSDHWPELAAFLKRELPVLPLPQQVIVHHPLDSADMDQLVSQLLVKRIAGITMIKQPDERLQESLAKRLLPTIYNGSTIQWFAVQGLLMPFDFPVDEQLDEGTKQWLRALIKLRVKI